MLDEWRPLMCPFDVTMQKAITYFELFLPTTLPPELHHKGFKYVPLLQMQAIIFFRVIPSHWWLSSSIFGRSSRQKRCEPASLVKVTCRNLLVPLPYWIKHTANQAKLN